MEKQNIKAIEKETHKELFRKYAETKDLKIREELINKNIYIADILAKKYVNRGIEYDDIYQVACIGLIYAIDRFDVSLGYEFSSFATPTIIGEIKKHFRDKGWMIRVPRRIQELSNKISNAQIIISQRLQKTPNIKEIAEYLNSTEEEILEAMEARKVYNTQSLNLVYDTNSEDKDLSLSELIGVDDAFFSKMENRDFLIKSMDKLDYTEKRVLSDRYIKSKTQMEIAKDLKVSQMTVSRVERKAIERLRVELNKTCLFLN